MKICDQFVSIRSSSGFILVVFDITLSLFSDDDDENGIDDDDDEVQ